MEIDTWLRAGGLVVAASERAARALTETFHRTRSAEGLTAWPAPNIQDWRGFLRSVWEERSIDGRLALNPLQEQALWAEIVAASGQRAALLEGPRHRMAGLAMDAHQLLCAYAPQFLKAYTRSGWQQDAEVFSGWLTDFDKACRTENLMSSARLPLELIPLLQADSTVRPPLLLAGFDRILPVQRVLFDAWGTWQEAPLGETAARIHFYASADSQTELTASALWCKQELAAHPHARLLVITQDVAKRRGEIERAFLRHMREAAAASPLFEFSLGVPLGQVALARGAQLLLRWLTAPIEENELDWLLSTRQIAADVEEAHTLTAFMRALRRRGLERTRWTLTDFLHQTPGAELPSAWVARLTETQNRLKEFMRRPSAAADPIAWAELIPSLLEIAGWPGAGPLSSAEFQTLRRWQQTVDDCASLGFDGSRVQWTEFLSLLRRAVDEALFAPESRDAPILIAGPAESAGLTADAVWFLGANEDAWPASGVTHPFLPLQVQREAGMPHGSPQLDWELAEAMTRRLLASSPEVHFSYARQSDGIEARPSRLMVQLAGPPQPLSANFIAPEMPDPITVYFADSSHVPFPAGAAPGGSSVLTYQSQCAFKAFAATRLGAQGCEPAEAGLTAAQRGQLLHDVLHSIWSGPPNGITTHKELLQNAENRRPFVENHVRTVLRDKMPSGVRAWMPPRYLELEQERLIDLVTEWLDYEATRLPFTVLDTEVDAAPSIDGLRLKLRLDRIDRLNDGSLLVIDYKSGDVSPKSWDLPRPDDVQLPLYAGFALDPDADLGGLVFAKVRAGEPTAAGFSGRVSDAKATLLPNLSGSNDLVKNRLTSENLTAWRDYIEQMARDFIAGRADVDPRDAPKTCERCGLQTLCRIQETAARYEAEDEGEDEADDA